MIEILASERFLTNGSGNTEAILIHAFYPSRSQLGMIHLVCAQALGLGESPTMSRNAASATPQKGGRYFNATVGQMHATRGHQHRKVMY
jgi:hypothetical protein